MSWVADGIDSRESEVVQELLYIAVTNRSVVSSIIALDWLQDEVTDLEAEAVENLSYLSQKNEGQASRIVAMPFLETLDPPDVSALASLVDMSWFRQADFQRVLSHPTLNAGITDDWTKIVATLYGVSDTNPALIDTLLNPEQVSIEERTIVLPIAGETLLTIIRTGPGAERSMDLLEHSVRRVEEFIGLEFPNRYVGWLVGEAVTPTFGGNNFGTHIATLPEYDVDDSSNSAELAGHLVAHEVAHYYWLGNSNWLDEGAADLMASVSENSRTSRPVEATNNPCGYLRTIAELEALEVTNEEGADSAFICNYALGERLFLDLYRNLGEDSFREGLRDLYILSLTVQEDDTEDDSKIGIEHVKTAFKSGDQITDSLVDVIVSRWYDDAQPYDASTRDITPPDPRFLTINGRINTAYLAATEEGTLLTSISADAVDDWLWLFLRWDKNVGSDTEVPLEFVYYYEDGFAFKRSSVTFTAYGYSTGNSWWLQVGQSPDNPWAVGNYELHVYNEGRKLVELEYEVTE